jgi:glucans biosynthesis protein
MTRPIDRRAVLGAFSAAAVAGLYAEGGAGALAAEPGLKVGPPAPFGFEMLKVMAHKLAAAPYAPTPKPAPEILDQLDYDAWGKIDFDMDKALFREGPFPVTFFHLGRFFQSPVAVYAVKGGQAREIVYDPAYFHMPANSPAHGLQKGAGFAGIRVQEKPGGQYDWRKNDWAAFLGASYFRAIGALHQYGLSARAVAVDTAVYGKAEDFPAFTKLYIEEPQRTGDSMTVYALLDGASVVGACRIAMTREKGVVMDIDQMLIPRRPIARFGLAPLTSMYWFSETVKGTAIDWRPEVHDSDGLAIWNGKGERLWRPLNDPPHPAVSAFADENPKGYGLLQRDRNFDHYLDGVYYDRRPSLWVEPKGPWGRGAVQLVELPTNDEINDNIGAMWVPEAPAQPGKAVELGYRLSWLADEPHPTTLARCVATRLGAGGQPGQPRPPGVRKFVVEFLGGPLTALPFGAAPEPVLQASRGRFTDYRLVEAVPDWVAGHWRVQFDLTDVQGSDPVDLRLHLVIDGKIASEVWMFQYHPFV